MDKKTYIKPGSTVIDMGDLMEGNGPVKNSGKGFKFKDEPVDGDDLDGKGYGWDDSDVFGSFCLPRGKAWESWD